MIASLALLLLACGTDRRSNGGGIVLRRDAGPTTDGGNLPGADAGLDGGDGRDAGLRDGGTLLPGRDAGFRDGGDFPGRDAGFRDAGFPRDAGFRDGGVRPRDAGAPIDAGFRDAGSAVDSGTTGQTTISQIQQGQFAEGTNVFVQNVVVTAVHGLGVWVQDPTTSGPYTGIRVYIAAVPSVVVGDRVNVSGVVREYFGDSEIDVATLTYLGPGTPIAPLSVTVAQAVTEPYEGVLVRLTNIASIDSTWNCANDDPGCNDFGLWQVNGTAGIVVYDFVYESADWSARVGDIPITGVMSWRYNRRRILPRTSADFGP